MSSEFGPADTAAQFAPPSRVNSNEVVVRIRPCCGSEKDTCKIASFPAECGDQVSPPSSVVRNKPLVPAAYPNLSLPKPIFSSTAPSVVSCFTSQCSPPSDDSATDSSVPHTHNEEPTLVVFKTRKGRFLVSHCEAVSSSLNAPTSSRKIAMQIRERNLIGEMVFLFVGITIY